MKITDRVVLNGKALNPTTHVKSRPQRILHDKLSTSVSEGRVADWIEKHSRGYDCLVDLGAGLFNMTEHSRAKRTIGVEVFEEYISNTTHGENIEKVCGDILDVEDFELPEYDIAMMIDVIEHIEKPAAIELLGKLKRMDHVEKIIIFTPDGNYEQDFDDWGYGNDKYQTHRSAWSASDFENLGFTVATNPSFHWEGMGALFADWVRTPPAL